MKCEYYDTHYDPIVIMKCPKCGFKKTEMEFKEFEELIDPPYCHYHYRCKKCGFIFN